MLFKLTENQNPLLLHLYHLAFRIDESKSKLVDFILNTSFQQLKVAILLGKNEGHGEVLVGWPTNISSVEPNISSDIDVLSSESIMNADAVAKLYHDNIINKIIISTGNTRGNNYNSEAKSIQNYLHKIHDIPIGCIELEENSHDTKTNAIELKKILSKSYANIKDVLLVTIRAHVPRAEYLLEEEFSKDAATKDIKIHSVSAESLKDIKNNEYIFSRSYLYSHGLRLSYRVKEFATLALQGVDKKNRIGAFFTRKRLKY